MSEAIQGPAPTRSAVPVLSLHNVGKRFPGVVALEDVSFDLYSGEVHVLVGENGAGKSTLVRILSGIYQPDSGEIRIEGTPERLPDPHAAQRLGISTVHQELNLIPHLTVGQNIYLGHEPMRGSTGLVDWSRLYQMAAEMLRSLQIDLDPRRAMRNVSIALQQMTEIAKALVLNARVLILDEPTAAITADEADQLFSLVHRLREQGTAIIFISHHLDEVTRIGDRVTVLRDGTHVITTSLDGISEQDLIRHMVGRELNQQFPERSIPIGEPILSVRNVSQRERIRDVSFDVHRGEIVGLAGLVGAGRTEVARAIFGIDPLTAGSISLHGQPVRVKSPKDAIRQGIALLPEDRKQQGLMLKLSVADNIVMVSPDEMHAPLGLVPPRHRIVSALRFVKELGIRAPSPLQRVELLSGGNQQKVVIAKWLMAHSDLMIFDEPTRGIDVGAKLEVYRLMNALLQRGAGIIMISSELPELLGMADRILVMREGRIVAELGRHEASQEQIMTHASTTSREEVA